MTTPTPDPMQQWQPPQQQLPQLPQAPTQSKSTPLDPPVIYYNQIWRVPPLVVDTQEAADALDPNEWTIGAPAVSGGPAAAKSQEQWPQLYANVTVPPKIVSSKEDAAALGDGWRAFSLPDPLCKAAEANNAAKAKADEAKAQAQSQSQSQSQTPAQPAAPYYPGQPYYPGPNPYPPPGY